MSRRGLAGPAGRAALLLGPAAWSGLFLLAPVAVLVWTSVGSRPPEGGVLHDGSFEGWRWVGDHLGIVARTGGRALRIAAWTTALALLLATPTAWWLARQPPRRRRFLVLLVVVPSFTSFLLRTYAWRWAFGNEGPLNTALESLGFAPWHALNSETAVVLGLLHGYLPFAVLPMLFAVERVDPEVLAAARDLGATRWRAWLDVGRPLTRAGTAAAAALVFVPSVAAFVTPAVLGGADTYVLGQLTQERFLQARDHPAGAALGVCFVVATLLALLPWFLARRRAVDA